MAFPFAAQPWWAFVVRGLLAILFGVLTFVWPAMALFTLVLLFGVWSIAEGILNFAGGLQRAPGRGPRWPLVVAGVVSILAGIVAFAMPGITALALLFVIAAWSIARGIVEIVAAVHLRNELRGEWLLALAGVLSVAFGILIAVFPRAGALAVVLWIGAYAIVLGGILLALGLRLRRRTGAPRPGGGFHELAHEAR